jgi:hypothetical protein
MPKHQNTSSSITEHIINSFSTLLSTQTVLPNYPLHFCQTRSTLLQWLSQISTRLSLSLETLHRAITLFDLYISSTPNLQVTNLDLKLSLIACLSLASKLHEINANYNVFLTNNLLLNDHLTAVDLHEKEIEILKSIDYCVTSSNIYTFNSSLSNLCANVINDEKMKAKFLYVNKCILQQYILTKEALLLNPINSAIHIINCTLSKFNESDLDKSNIVNSILTIRN